MSMTCPGCKLTCNTSHAHTLPLAPGPRPRPCAARLQGKRRVRAVQKSCGLHRDAVAQELGVREAEALVGGWGLRYGGTVLPQVKCSVAH